MRSVYGYLLCVAVAAASCSDNGAAAAPAAERVAPAAEFRSRRVDGALDDASALLRTRGLARDGGDWRGFLVDTGSQTSEVSMRSGTCYVLIGAASSALRELDLRVFDSDGGEVARDANAGRRAGLRFCPAQSGTYYVAARAAIGSGLFAVRRFKGPTGLGVRVDDVFRGAEPEAAAPRERTP